MNQALARFERYIKRRFGQTSTLKHYISDLNIFIDTVDNKAPEAVTADDIDTFLDNQITAGLSPATINRRLASVHTSFEYLAGEKPERDWPNPVIHRRHRLKTGSHLPRDVPDDVVAGLFGIISDERDRAMFGLMVGAGLRVGEVADLRLGSLEEPAAPGQLARLRVRGKGNKDRVVWLTDSLCATLRAWLEVRPEVETDHLFLNRRGEPISVSGIQYCLKQHCRAIDVYLSWHWPTWRAQTAYQLGSNLIYLIRQVGTWLATQRQVDGWDTFRRADLEAWLQARCQDGVTDVTIRNELARLRGLLKFLEARDYPLDPGLFRVQPPKLVSSSLPRYLPEVEYRRLETVVRQATKADTYLACFDRAWFLTLAHTGLRISELLDLRLGDMSLAAGYSTIRSGKPGRDRVVYLTPALDRALRRYLNRRPDLPDDDHIFVLRGRSPTARTIQRRLARYGQQAGVQVTAHRLRHTIATRLINQGMPIHSLRKFLGHQHLNTTQIYARIYDETLYEQFKAAMSRLEAIAVHDWPVVDVREPALAEMWTVGPA